MTLFRQVIILSQDFLKISGAFAEEIFGFLSYEIPFFEVTVFQFLLGSGIGLFLVYTIVKWIAGVVT